MKDLQITLQESINLAEHVTLNILYQAVDIYETNYNAFVKKDQQKDITPDGRFYQGWALAAVLYAGYTAGVRAERVKRKTGKCSKMQ